MKKMKLIFTVVLAICFAFYGCEKDNGGNGGSGGNGGGGTGGGGGGGGGGNVIAPIADFSFSPSKPIAPCTVYLTNTSSGKPTNFQWQLGNSTYTTENISMIANEPGTYSVKLTVSNSAGSNSITKNIKVYSDCEANEYGWIKFSCTSNYSYDLYINGTFKERIPGRTSLTYKLNAGTYNCRVEQVSGYIFYPTIESKSIKVESCYTTTWSFPNTKDSGN